MCKVYNKWQALFSFQDLEFRSLKSAQTSWKLRHQLWDAMNTFNNRQKQWTTSPFLTVDCEDLNKEVAVLLKTAFVLDKKVCGGPPLRARALLPCCRAHRLSTQDVVAFAVDGRGVQLIQGAHSSVQDRYAHDCGAGQPVHAPSPLGQGVQATRPRTCCVAPHRPSIEVVVYPWRERLLCVRCCSAGWRATKRSRWRS